MWVRILRDRDFTPPEDRRITVAYKADAELSVKRAWGEALVAAGDAEEIPAPGRADGDPDTDEDGHDDKTGQFVDGNTAGRRRRAAEVPKA